jgi:hypothetical protein
MSIAYTLHCRQCGATPARRKDRVAESAVAYTCSRCLIGQLPGSAPEPAESAPSRDRDQSRSALAQRLRARARDRARRKRITHVQEVRL